MAARHALARGRSGPAPRHTPPNHLHRFVSPPALPATSPLSAAVDLALARVAHPDLCVPDPHADMLVRACSKGDRAESGAQASTAQASTARPSQTPPTPSASPSASALDAAATAWIDAHALSATDLVNMDVGGGGAEYRQVLLLSPGLDTRPFRLPWPPGVVLFEAAPADCLAVSAAACKAAGLAAPRGCLLVRVLADLSSGEDWVDRLAGAGWRGDRLSIVCLQVGSPALALTRPALRAALAAAARSAARGSFLFGDLPGWVSTRAEAADLLAEAGFLVGALERPGHSALGGAAAWASAGWGDEADPASPSSRWLFAAQQQGRSDGEMQVLDDHMAAAAEAEDFLEGTFS